MANFKDLIINGAARIIGNLYASSNIYQSGNKVLDTSNISTATNSTSTTTVASSSAVKSAYDLAASKTANTGTVTSVAVQMNGATKGTVTSSGTIDLGTVITSHQDISGKQDKTTAVTHTASTAVGGTTTPVYIASNGTATALSYTIAKSVPSDAKFTDTTYSDATTSAHGLMSTSDKTKLDGVATGATKNSFSISGTKLIIS